MDKMKELIDIDSVFYLDNPDNLEFSDNTLWEVVNIYNKECDSILQKVFSKKNNTIPLHYFRILPDSTLETARITPFINISKEGENFLGLSERDLRKKNEFVPLNDPHLIEFTKRALMISSPTVFGINTSVEADMKKKIGVSRSIGDTDCYMDYVHMQNHDVLNGFYNNDRYVLFLHGDLKHGYANLSGNKSFNHLLFYHKNKLLDCLSNETHSEYFSVKMLNGNTDDNWSGVTHFMYNYPHHSYYLPYTGTSYNESPPMLDATGPSVKHIPVSRFPQKSTILSSGTIRNFIEINRVSPLMLFPDYTSSRPTSEFLSKFNFHLNSPYYFLSTNGLYYTTSSGNIPFLEATFSSYRLRTSPFVGFFKVTDFPDTKKYWNTDKSPEKKSHNFATQGIITSFEISPGKMFQFLEFNMGTTHSLFFKRTFPEKVYKYKATRIVNNDTKNLDLHWNMNINIPSLRSFFRHPSRWRIFCFINGFRPSEVASNKAQRESRFITQRHLLNTFREEM